MRRCLPAAAVLAALLTCAPAAGAFPADFTWQPDPPVQDRPALFTAVQDASVTDYLWDLDGNGRYHDPADRSGPQVEHTFGRARVYTIGLVTVDVEGAVSESRKDVTVVSGAGGDPGPDQPPEASFVFFPADPVAGEQVTFVSTSIDADSPIAASSLQWDLNGDRAFGDAQGSSAAASYAAAGTYDVSLRVTTNATDVATLALGVGAPGFPAASAGQRGLSLMSPFPVVRIAGRVSRRGARIRRLTVDAPPGASVSVACRGRGCPFRRTRKRISTRLRADGRLPVTRLLRIRRLERRLLRPGAVLRLYVTRAGSVGKYTRFIVRRRRAPARRDLCLVPGATRPLGCPTR